MKEYIWYGILFVGFMWEIGRSTSAYFAYKKWKKYYMIENEFLQKICIRNKSENVLDLRHKNKLRQPAFIIYTILIPIAFFCYIIDIILALNTSNKITQTIRLIALIIGILTFLSTVLIGIIDGVLTERGDKRFP